MLWGDSQDKTLLAEFQRLIAFRRSHPALVYGAIETLALDDGHGSGCGRGLRRRPCADRGRRQPAQRSHRASSRTLG